MEPESLFRRARRALFHAGAWIFQWSAFYVLWFVLVGSLAPNERIVGAGAAALGATASHAVWSAHFARFSIEPRLVAQALHLVVDVFSETVVVLDVLWQQVARGRPAESLFRVVPFEAGGEDPRSVARRALAVAFTTASPNFVAIGIDETKGVMLYHQLRETAVPALTRNLGARP